MHLSVVMESDQDRAESDQDKVESGQHRVESGQLKRLEMWPMLGHFRSNAAQIMDGRSVCGGPSSASQRITLLLLPYLRRFSRIEIVLGEVSKKIGSLAKWEMSWSIFSDFLPFQIVPGLATFFTQVLGVRAFIRQLWTAVVSISLPAQQTVDELIAAGSAPELLAGSRWGSGWSITCCAAPLVSHKKVAEVSKIGRYIGDVTYDDAWMAGRSSSLMDRKMVRVLFLIGQYLSPKRSNSAGLPCAFGEERFGELLTNAGSLAKAYCRVPLLVAPCRDRLQASSRRWWNLSL